MDELPGDLTTHTAAVQERPRGLGGNQVDQSRLRLGVPFNARVPWAQYFFLPVQNMLVMVGLLGTFSSAIYPENVGLLRSSKVCSCWVTVTAGSIFIVAGFVYKVGTVFVSIPSGVIGAAAVAMFAIIMVFGIEILSRVEWVPRNIIVKGLPTVLSAGGVFLSHGVRPLSPAGQGTDYRAFGNRSHIAGHLLRNRHVDTYNK